MSGDGIFAHAEGVDFITTGDPPHPCVLLDVDSEVLWREDDESNLV